jgi:hypothetical protein
MKRTMFYMTALLILVVMVGFYSCNQSTTPTNTSQSDAFTPLNTSFVDFESYSEPINVASFDRDFLVITPKYGDLAIPRMFPLHSIFRALKLDSAQNVAVRGYLTSFKDCTAPIITDMQKAIINVTDSVRLIRRAILDSLKNNLITTAQAQVSLDSLNSQANQELANIILKYCPSLQDCLKTLLDNTTALINQTGTDTQKQVWQAFLAALPTDPCNPSNIKIRLPHHGSDGDNAHHYQDSLHKYQDSLHHYQDSLRHHDLDSLEHHLDSLGHHVLDSLRHHGHEGGHHR